MKCQTCGQVMRELWDFPQFASTAYVCPSCGCVTHIGPEWRRVGEHLYLRVIHLFVFEHESNTVEEW